MRNAIIFDDGRGQLAPLTDLRAAFMIRTGALTTLERLKLGLGVHISGVLTPMGLVGVTREALPGVAVNSMTGIAGDVLLVNGRCPLALPQIKALAPGQALVEPDSGDLVAMVIDASKIEALLGGEAVSSQQAELPGRVLMSRPWHVRTFRDAALDADLAILSQRIAAESAPGGVTVIGSHPVCIHPMAKVYPGVIIDAEHGAVVIDEGAVVRPASTLIGPVYIGQHSTVLDRAIVKGHSAIGPWCKVAGEVGGTIFQGFANKAHDGHLGDSWIGEWSNLGAGTTNSNLLNTYGEVVAKAIPGGSNERTGEQFLGCIVGDHVKFAICTRIMTGSVVHSGTMWASRDSVTGCVPGFSWATDAGVKPFRFDKFVEIARTVMMRRKLTMSQAYLERLAEVHGG